VLLSTIGPEDEIRNDTRKSLVHEVSTVSVGTESNA
jgi:hypothetical protein